MRRAGDGADLGLAGDDFAEARAEGGGVGSVTDGPPRRQAARIARPAIRSRCAPPPFLKRVISAGPSPPGAAGDQVGEVAEHVARAMTPRASGSRSSPMCASVVSKLSTKMRPRRSASSSASRMSARKAPTRSRCWPGRSQAPRSTGSVAMVAVATMSAAATAAGRSAATSAPVRAASAAARAGERFQSVTAMPGKPAR